MALKDLPPHFKEHGLKSRELLGTFFSREDLKKFAKALENVTAKDMSLAVSPSPAETSSLVEDERFYTRSELLPASDAMINMTIRDVYDEAEGAGMKPPNVKEIVKPVQNWLRKSGRKASGRRIQQIAERYKDRRREPGATVASERRRQQ